MTSFREGLTNGLRGAACTLVGGRPEWLRQYNEWVTPTGLVPLARTVQRWVCGVDPDTEPDVPPPPFEGGQCPVAYLVNFTNSGSGPSTASAFITGPVSGVRRDGPNQFGGFFWNVLGGNGAEATFRGTSDAGEQWSISTVSRLDSQPDNCGDPPIVLPPPGNVSVDIDIIYGDNDEFSLTVPVVFAPLYIALDGSINVPVTVQIDAGLEITGTLELFPDFEFSPTIEFGGDTGDGQPDPGPPPDSPTGPGNDGDPDPETPEEVEDRVYSLICRARIESDARPSGIFQQVGPDIYVPRLGSARFGATIGGVVFWSEDIDIKGLNSVIQCPIPWGADRFLVNAQPGVVIAYSPVKTAPAPWPPYIQVGSQALSDNR